VSGSRNPAIIGGIVAVAAIVSVAAWLGDPGSVVSDAGQGEPPEIQERLDAIQKNAELSRETSSQYEPGRPRDWITSGPFQIDRTEYALGELVMTRINDLSRDDKGQIVFMRPINATHYEAYTTIPFDGSDKETFNRYFKPALSQSRGICTADQLAGQWLVVFRGTDHPNISFAINPSLTVPGSEENYQPVC